MNTSVPGDLQVVILTGASDGIGAEMARQLAQHHGPALGLVLAARSLAGLESTAAHCRELGAQCLIVPTDVAQEDQCRALIAQAVAYFGHIDTLVNNAGVSAQALLADVQADDLHWYQHLMQINLWGSVWCTHAALPYLKARKGRIVAVSSLATVYALSAADDDAASQALTPLISDGWSLATALSLLVWYIYAPMCISTLATIKRETNSWKQMGFAAFYLFAAAYVAALITYQVTRALGGG
jgi:NADP-dependent 3-hydroxy acid dehydrogenase YdfG